MWYRTAIENWKLGRSSRGPRPGVCAQTLGHHLGMAGDQHNAETGTMLSAPVDYELPDSRVQLFPNHKGAHILW